MKNMTDIYKGSIRKVMSVINKGDVEKILVLDPTKPRRFITPAKKRKSQFFKNSIVYVIDLETYNPSFNEDEIKVREAFEILNETFPNKREEIEKYFKLATDKLISKDELVKFIKEISGKVKPTNAISKIKEADFKNIKGSTILKDRVQIITLAHFPVYKHIDKDNEEILCKDEKIEEAINNKEKAKDYIFYAYNTPLNHDDPVERMISFVKFFENLVQREKMKRGYFFAHNGQIFDYAIIFEPIMSRNAMRKKFEAQGYRIESIIAKNRGMIISVRCPSGIRLKFLDSMNIYFTSLDDFIQNTTQRKYKKYERPTNLGKVIPSEKEIFESDWWKYIISDVAPYAKAVYNFFIEKLCKEKEIPIDKLISNASIAFRNVRRSMKHAIPVYNELEKPGFESYHGGLTETKIQLYFEGIIADINSSYPNAKQYSKIPSKYGLTEIIKVNKNAKEYGFSKHNDFFFEVEISAKIPLFMSIPILFTFKTEGRKVKGSLLNFPKIRQTITHPEYDCLLNLMRNLEDEKYLEQTGLPKGKYRIKMKVIKVWRCKRNRQLENNIAMITNTTYIERQVTKKQGKQIESDILKTMLNGSYGKFNTTIELPYRKIRANLFTTSFTIGSQITGFARAYLSNIINYLINTVGYPKYKGKILDEVLKKKIEFDISETEGALIVYYDTDSIFIVKNKDYEKVKKAIEEFNKSTMEKNEQLFGVKSDIGCLKIEYEGPIAVFQEKRYMTNEKLKLQGARISKKLKDIIIEEFKKDPSAALSYIISPNPEENFYIVDKLIRLKEAKRRHLPLLSSIEMKINLTIRPIKYKFEYANLFELLKNKKCILAHSYQKPDKIIKKPNIVIEDKEIYDFIKNVGREIINVNSKPTENTLSPEVLGTSIDSAGLEDRKLLLDLMDSKKEAVEEAKTKKALKKAVQQLILYYFLLKDLISKVTFNVEDVYRSSFYMGNYEFIQFLTKYAGPPPPELVEILST